MELDDDRIRDGFPGERMTVLPRPRVRSALAAPATSAIVVTDVGFFPRALHHGRQRHTPVPQAIILICDGGSGWVQTNGERIEVTPGQVVVIPPAVSHEYGADDGDPWTLWWLHVDGHLVAPWCALIGVKTFATVRTLVDPTEAVSLVQEILSRLQTDTAQANVLAAAGAAWHLLTLLVVRQLRTDSTPDVIESATRYLREHYASRTTVPELAARSHLSVSHFTKRFREQIGQSVSSYITDLRMARARELLDFSVASISDIAVAVGYDDPFYFSRQFRKVHGVTPSAYRSHRKG